MIQMCHPSLLLTLTTCTNPKSTQVLIEQRLFKYVARRIANIIRERSVIGYSSISSLELWNDSNFHEHVLLSEECTLKFKTCRDTNGDSMIVHFSKVGNKRWVEYLLPNSEKRQRYRSINAACSKNQPNIVNLILSSDVECDLQTCFYAVQSGNIELLLRVCEFVDLHQISHSLHPTWSHIRHSLLKEICFMQQTQLIEQVLAKYPFLVDIMDCQGSNSLQSAASSGDKHAFNLLLKFGFDPYEKDRDNGHTVLTCACQKGRTDMVKYLVDKYPALLQEHTDIHGKSLLHWAAFSGNIDMFEYILDIFENENILHLSRAVKPQVDGKDNSGESILHFACENGHYDMCKYLLRRYPQLLDVCDNDGANVLHSAAVGGNVDLFKFLSSKGLNVNCTTNTGKTVLHMSCNGGREEMCRYLVNMYPSLISITDNNRWTVLHSACFGGSVEIVSFLIEKEMDINTLSNDGKTILHIACLNGKHEICEYLVENYSHLLDVRDKSSNTALHAAAWGGNVQIVKLLIEKKMDIYSVQKGGETILHQCCRFGKMEMCEHLVDNFPDLLAIRDTEGWTVLHSACCGGSVEIVSFLIEKGMDINILSNDGRSILHIACLNGKFEVCEYLIENYPNLSDVRDKSSNSVLHDAAWGGNVQIVKLLIEKKMDINVIQEEGETVLHQCCRSGKIEMCEYLVNHFPDLLEIRDNDGWTVLHSACSGGSVDIISFLLKKGLDINVLSNVGESILHIACLNGKHDVCGFLSTNHQDLLAAWGGNVQIVKDN
ncbi:putative ankyrin repeat protein RF_0381 [Saccostrea cucullata]|uniref:putative ankyrin repeat protein RF_0381 n=1 Tax=Saccostrea cuccullata TaxID=36930 RepID=UPI002ED37187